MLLLLVAACVWWGAAVRADRFDEAAVLRAGTPAGTLEVPVGTQVVLWSSAGTPRCTARDLTFDQQLQVTEPVQDYRRGVLAGAPARVLDALVPSRWTPVGVLHTGGDRLRLTCDPASTGDLAVSTAPEVVTGVAALRHGWSPLAVCAAVLTVSGAGLLVTSYARRRVRRAAPLRPTSAPAPTHAAARAQAVRVPAPRRADSTGQRKSISSMSVSVPSERKRSSS